MCVLSCDLALVRTRQLGWFRDCLALRLDVDTLGSQGIGIGTSGGL